MSLEFLLFVDKHEVLKIEMLILYCDTYNCLSGLSVDTSSALDGDATTSSNAVASNNSVASDGSVAVDGDTGGHGRRTGWAWAVG